MSNHDIYRMHELLLPVFWLIAHFLGAGMPAAITTSNLTLIIISLTDIIIGSVIIAFILDVAYFKGHIKTFWILLVCMFIIMIVFYTFIIKPNWLGFWSSIITLIWYSLCWWSTANNTDDDDC